MPDVAPATDNDPYLCRTFLSDGHLDNLKVHRNDCFCPALAHPLRPDGSSHS